MSQNALYNRITAQDAKFDDLTIENKLIINDDTIITSNTT